MVKKHIYLKQIYNTSEKAYPSEALQLIVKILDVNLNILIWAVFQNSSGGITVASLQDHGLRAFC